MTAGGEPRERGGASPAAAEDGGGGTKRRQTKNAANEHSVITHSKWTHKTPPLPLCRAYPIVGYCGSFLNKLPSQKENQIRENATQTHQSRLELLPRQWCELLLELMHGLVRVLALGVGIGSGAGAARENA